jgi:hypothetical protein
MSATRLIRPALFLIVRFRPVSLSLISASLPAHTLQAEKNLSIEKRRNQARKILLASCMA